MKSLVSQVITVGLVILISSSFPYLGCIPLGDPKVTQPTQVWPQLWYEFDGYFYTNDLIKAQQEIPFTIILPSYVPDRRASPRPPSIKGPLKEYQRNNDFRLEVLYYVDLGGPTPSKIWIWEGTNPVIAYPNLTPDIEVLVINGETVWRQVSLGNPTYIFNFNSLGIVVEFDGFPEEEALKVVSSMLGP